MEKESNPLMRYLSVLNTSSKSITVIFEPWLTEVEVLPGKQLDIELSGELDEYTQYPLDIRPQIWIGEDGHMTVHGWRTAEPRAFIDGKEIPNITY